MGATNALPNNNLININNLHDYICTDVIAQVLPGAGAVLRPRDSLIFLKFAWVYPISSVRQRHSPSILYISDGAADIFGGSGPDVGL